MAPASARQVSFPVGDDPGRGDRVSGLWLRPRGAHCILALAHGAGAGMRHAFLEALAAELADRGVATFRYQFPYMERGLRRPDGRARLLATVRAGVREAGRRARGLPVYAGGKSMGGRMTSLAASEEPLPRVQGIVFVGFPLHPAGRPGSERAQHLGEVQPPMLFLQGTRDGLAELPRLRPICRRLGRRARLHVVEGADHGFHVLKRSGRTDSEVRAELGEAIAGWTRR